MTSCDMQKLPSRKSFYHLTHPLSYLLDTAVAQTNFIDHSTNCKTRPADADPAVSRDQPLKKNKVIIQPNCLLRCPIWDMWGKKLICEKEKKDVLFAKIFVISRKSCNTLLVACGHLAIWESAKSMSHGGGFGAFSVVKRGPKRGHYAYARAWDSD